MLNYIIACASALTAVGFAAPSVPQVQGPDRVVLIDAIAFPAAELAKAQKQGLSHIMRDYSARGYTEVRRKDKVFLFSPTAWAKQGVEGLAGAYEDLARLTDEHGLVDVRKSPSLSAFVQSGFGDMMRFVNPGQSAFALSPTAQLQLTDGQRTVSVHLVSPPSAAERDRELAARPLQRDDAAIGKAAAERREPPSFGFQLPRLDQVHLAVFGKGSTNAANRSEDLAEATNILAERYRCAQDRLQALRDALLLSALGQKSGLDAIRNGSGASSLPEPWGSMASSFLSGNYKRLGFQEEGDASAFFARARVRSSSVVWALVGSQAMPDGSRMEAMFGLP